MRDDIESTAAAEAAHIGTHILVALKKKTLHACRYFFLSIKSCSHEQ